MLDYDRDIAPLNQTYFPELMGGEAFDRAMAFRQEKLMPMRLQTMKLIDDQFKRDAAMLSYQTAQLGLEAKKKEIENQQRYKSMEPDIYSRVDSILDNPELTDAEKREDIFEVQRDYIGAFTNSPAVNNYFSTVENQFKIKTAADAANKASTSALRNSLAQTYYNVAQRDGSFDPAYFTGIREGSVSVDDASIFINDLNKITKQAAEEEAKEKGERELIKSFYEDTRTLVEGAAFKEVSGGEVTGEDEQEARTLAGGESKPSKFLVFDKPRNRKLLKDALLKFSPDLTEEVEGMSDMGLRDALLDVLDIFGKKQGFIPTLRDTSPTSDEANIIGDLTGTN